MDGRLGRRFVGHDERSRAFGIASALPSTVVRRPTFWALPRWTCCPLDQGQEGQCASHSLAHELAAGPVQVKGMTGRWARRMFQRITATDRAMGNDFQGQGATMLASAKTAKADGYITGYRWCFGADQVVATLVSTGPVWLGVPWFEASYETGRDGLLSIAGACVGGHAITAVGYDEHPTHGPIVALLNSWGPQFGVADRRVRARGGVAYLRVADLDTLLRQDGEAIIAADFVRT